MTRILFTVSLLFVTIVALASPITETEAQQKAADFIFDKKNYGKNIQSKSIVTDDFNFTTAESCDAFYVFNNETSGGYVIVSADDRMPAVLGYSYTGTFKSDEIPENMRAWLNGYVEQYEYMLEHDNVTAVSTTSVVGDKIDPLLTTTWNQLYPYNAKCPTIAGKSVPAGCVATAMAQIMYYYQWPKKTTKVIPGYTTNTRNIVMPEIEITTIDWDNMFPVYDNYGNYSIEEEEAISKLFTLCGTAVEIDYDTDGSGANTANVMSALGKYFDYPNYMMSHIGRWKFKQNEWNQIIYDEIKNKRPVLYSGYSSSSGHAFIIDGYDKDDFFHVNWGWGGYQDDYFLLNALNGYNSNQDAIIGIDSPVTPDGVKYAYAMYQDNTLTFYYDNKRDERYGVLYTSLKPFYDSKNYREIMDWHENVPSITSVVFDDSFSECNVTSTVLWFNDMKKIKSLDLSNLNTQNVTNMAYMFLDCSSLTNLNLSSFNTLNVTDMTSLFYGCANLTNLNLSSFNTQNVTNMRGMFYNCSNLTSLDLCNFDTKNVTDMKWMFWECKNIKNILVSDKWNTNNLTDSRGMFSGCFRLVGQDGTKYNSNNATDATMAHYGTGGYLTYKSPTAVDVINQNLRQMMPSKYYSVDGKNLLQPQKGLNILKMSDGTTRKVVK